MCVCIHSDTDTPYDSHCAMWQIIWHFPKLLSNRINFLYISKHTSNFYAFKLTWCSLFRCAKVKELMRSVYDLLNMLKPVATVPGFLSWVYILLLSQWTTSFVSQQMFHCLAPWCKVASVEVGTLAASFEFSPIECHQPPPSSTPTPKLLREGLYPSPLSPLTPCRPHSHYPHHHYDYNPPWDLLLLFVFPSVRSSLISAPPPHTHIKNPIYWPIESSVRRVYLHQYTFKCSTAITQPQQCVLSDGKCIDSSVCSAWWQFLLLTAVTTSVEHM